MNGITPGTIIPWLLGGLALLAFLTLSITFKSWREAKRSPYFFLRIQAAKRMQRYLVASLLVILVTIATTAYAWNSPEDTTQRVARLSYAKPVQQAAAKQAPSEEAAPATVEISLSPGVTEGSAPNALAGLTDPLLQTAALPDEFSALEPSADLSENTAVGEISFSTDISNDYQAVDPGRRFVKGYFTLYATFDYAEMTDGMTWSWLWKRNGQVIEGGNQVWSYGDSGPGYVYLRPEEGFFIGDYALEVWVNDKLMAQSNFTVIDGISANN